ncbi:MAG: hypothetical protein PW791_08975 [Neorhizobium sp.]|nr:hypothetical protein [Neorhizobium sp.]
MNNVAPIGNRETVAESLAGRSDDEKSWLSLMMENPAMDDVLLDGLHLHLEQASAARFLNSIKLQAAGEWLGTSAPARLQIRLMEAARSSQHPAYGAFRDGLAKSGGLERAFPKSAV